jgi:predicted ATPase
VFDNVQLEFAKGINIIIGANGTGKTHVLKSLYAVCERVNNGSEDVFDISQPYFSVNPMDLVRDKTDRNNHTGVTVYFSDESYATYVISKHEGMKLAADGGNNYCTDFKMKTVYIPAKEMLSHSKGFLALYNKYDIPFDKTYVDILTNAELPETREISKLNESLLHIISKVIDGKIVHENGTFYVMKTDGNKIEFPIEAEGLRKFGLLWKLIRNGLLEKETILFWDEPEANINPELMPTLVEILLELQRKGVQLFIATHSYNLAKYFEIKRNDTDQVLYHHLYKTVSGVQADSDPYFGELKDNPIIEADAKLLDEVIKGNFDD